MCNGKRSAYEALDQFFHTYLVERDLEKTLSLLTEDLYSLGTGAEEVAVSQAEFAALLREQFSALPGPIHYQISRYHEKERAPGLWDCLCQMTTTLAADGGRVIEFAARFTASLQERDGRLLIASLHMSEASSNQAAGAFFPLRFADCAAQALEAPAQLGLVSLLGELLPGGVIGAYLEEGFPFYAVNDTLLDMLGYTHEEFLAATGGLVSNAVHVDDRPILDSLFSQLAFRKGRYELEYRMRKKDGDYLWVYETGKRIVTPEGRDAAICLVSDMTERVRQQELLLREARLDPLTGVYNRRGGEEQIARALREDLPWMFLLLDIDFFKQVNDLYGHQEGDRLLCFVARHIKAGFRSGDIILRLGGDEFGVFIQPCTGPEIIRQRLEEMGRQYHAEIQARYPLSGSSLSFGGVYGSGPAAFSALYQEADLLLYGSKQHGRGRYQLRPLDRSRPALRGRTTRPAISGPQE